MVLIDLPFSHWTHVTFKHPSRMGSLLLNLIVTSSQLTVFPSSPSSHRPATLKDFRTQELALERQTRLWELSKFEPIGTRQEEIAKKFCRLQIREEGTRLNMATQTAIGFALSRFLA